MHTEVRDKRFLEVAGENVHVEQVATGFGFTEGPVWDRARKRLIWSDMKHDHMRSWSPERGVETYRKPSNKANGSTYDPQGRLVSCEHDTSRVVREEVDGSLTVLASHWRERELNSPNDIVAKTDGAIYFSDPTFGRIREDVGILRPLTLDFRGVYRVSPDGSRLELLADDFEQPNGLCFSLDEKRLYINDTPRKHIRVFDVRADGTIANGRIFGETTGELPGAPDGMKIDSAGHLYCTGPGGIHVFDRDGRCLGVILTPERPTNLAWGDKDLRTLYITAQTSVYKTRLGMRGHLGY
ncbi:MAG TPA: SMP-30/gluconolactonase/LRE family protein [Burkholderiales bacterium]|nr:SMP-30/gluconolactonase/LRE family protein [Burkholderiales bacterium]